MHIGAMPTTPPAADEGFLETLGAEVDAMIADDPEASLYDVSREVLARRSDPYDRDGIWSTVVSMAAVGLKRAQAAIDEAAANAENDRERLEEEATDAGLPR